MEALRLLQSFANEICTLKVHVIPTRFKVWILSFCGLVHQINSLCEVLKLKQIFRKNKIVTGKTQFFVIGPFCTPHSICLNVGFWQSRFVWKWCVFQKICFKVKVFKTFKISNDCHKKTCWSLKRRAVLKILSTAFLEIYTFSVGFKM